MNKSLFDKLDPDFLNAIIEIYIKAFKEEQKKLRELNAPNIRLKSEEEILKEVEDELISAITTVDPFEFAKEILAKKYGVEVESIRKKLPAAFTKRLRLQFPNIDEGFAANLIEDVKKKGIAKRISDINKKK